MADGQCDYADGNPHGRNWLLTRLSPPQTIELCDDHLAPGVIGILALELGVDMGTLYAAIERVVVREAKKAADALAAVQQAQDAGPAGETTQAGNGHPAGPGNDDDAQAADAAAEPVAAGDAT